MNSKTDQIRAAWAAGDQIRALRIAARFFDWSTSGVYVGLPTMTTADQAFERRKPFLDDVWITPVDRVLAHGRAKQKLEFKSTAERGDVEAGEADCVDWFARSSKRALLAPAGVGTVDQALLAGLRADYAGLRLLGLWGKVLVVDEVHAYDGYMLAVLEKLVEAQAAHGGSVVLMSATLPSRERTRLVRAFQRGLGQGSDEAARAAAALNRLVFPALTVVHGAMPPRLEPLDPVPGPGALERHFEQVGSVEAAVEAVVDHAKVGRSVVWFRNTVDDAREAYDRLFPETRQRGLPEPLLWHARFLPADRNEIEQKVITAASKDAAPADRRGQIAVATQVGEQSLDLDFDALISDLAPIDTLIQLSGAPAAIGATPPGVSSATAPTSGQICQSQFSRLTLARCGRTGIALFCLVLPVSTVTMPNSGLG